VLDGRHRLRAALELHLPDVPTAPAAVGGCSEVEYMVRAAVLRRHLSDDQRAILAARLREHLSVEAKRQRAEAANAARWSGAASLLHTVGDKETPSKPQTDTRALAAQQLSVPRRKLEQAGHLLTHSPDLAERVLAGSVPLHRALSEARRQSDMENLLRQPAPQPSERWQVLQGDLREVGPQIAPASVDLILTDPPYPGEYLPLWSDLGQLAARVLKPGAFLVTYSGQYYLPEVLDRLREHLAYFWLAGMVHEGNEARQYDVRRVSNKMKPILIFARPPVQQPLWFEDLVSSPASEKSLHPWQQSIGPARYLVQRFSRPGALVLDPFAGAGTFPAAALAEGRRALAIEIEAQCAEVVRRRLAGTDGEAA
ncbi:MAG: DNA modification methylase, partial [Chloroflexi bacterium]|nr:DNA modification methylase [Chloroflexota bacterium]